MITKNLFLAITLFSLFLVNCNNLQNSTPTKEENQIGIIKGNDFRSKAMMKFTDAYVNNDLNKRGLKYLQTDKGQWLNGNGEQVKNKFDKNSLQKN